MYNYFVTRRVTCIQAVCSQVEGIILINDKCFKVKGQLVTLLVTLKVKRRSGVVISTRLSV